MVSRTTITTDAERLDILRRQVEALIIERNNLRSIVKSFMAVAMQVDISHFGDLPEPNKLPTLMEAIDVTNLDKKSINRLMGFLAK